MKNTYLLLLSFLFIGCFDDRIEVQEPVITAPIQKNIKPMYIQFNKNTRIEKVATYDLDAIVLSKTDYSDEDDGLIPYDLALG
jgi:hypothetical protein